jgi:sulfur carrier protein
MQVLVNGRPRPVDPGRTVGELIESLGLDLTSVVVELNGEALGRERYLEAALSDGDRVEIVRAVAGG